MKKSKIMTVLLLINLFLIGFVTSSDASQNNLSSNYSDMLRRPPPISDDISRFIPSEKGIQNSFYQINPIPDVKPDTPTYKSLTTTSNNSLKITSLNYTNIAKPKGLVNISFTVDGYIDNTNYYIGIFDWAKWTWIKDESQYHNGTFSKKYDWNFTAPSTGQNYWLSTWYWEYSNSSWIFLDSADIIINLMLPDLTVKDIRFSNNIALVNISNSGYISADNISYLVYDGNPNPNYMGNNSYRKTELIYSDKIPVLNNSEFKLVNISFPIDQNFHKAYVVVDPMNTINETNKTNNNASKAMRLNSSVHVLDVLAVIYTNYVYNNLSTSQINFTKNQITNFKQFYWDHTLTLSLNISYMQIDDLYNNSHLWQISPGKYWMSPWDVESDLRNRGVTDNAYDNIYVFYAWKNTNGSEAAYGGAAYGPDINWMGNISYASEPIFCWDPNTIGEIAIHEVLHNIDGMYEVKGDSSFKSPDNMYSETTFTIPMEYYEWMLETWPTQKWYALKWGYFLPYTAVKGNDTVGIYQNSTGTFFLKNSNSAGASDSTFQFGPGGLTPIKGDYDGSGNDTAGVYNAGTGTFYLRNSNSAGAADATVQYGPGGSDFTPVVGDWNGDGSATIGIYQKSTGTFFLRNSNSAGAADITVQYGPGGSDFLPVVGDWDGSGNATIGIYRISTGTFFLRNSNSAGAADITVQYGPGGSDFLPVVGDWDGSGNATIGIYRVSTGTFFLRNSNSAGGADITVQYGSGGSDFLPVVGDWDGI